MGFTTGQPWLPLAAEHQGLSVAEQAADSDSTLAFARQVIALRRSANALRLGDIAFLDLTEPLLGFVRRHEGETIVCLFNLSAEPRVVEHPLLEGARLMPTQAGEADLRGGSVGLSPYAAVFLEPATG